MKTNLFSLILLFAASFCFAQPANWFNLDPEEDKVPGVSAERMHERLLKGQKGKTVIVAVLDSGVDYDHEDLKDVMWVNEDEIPNNGIDDDKNGYVDDVHGWNFLGNAKGENVKYDNLEITRIYRKLRPKYENIDSTKLSAEEKLEYQEFLQMEKDITESRAKYAQDYQLIKPFYEGLLKMKEAIGKEEITAEDVANFKSDDPTLTQVAGFVKNIMTQQGLNFEELATELKDQFEYFEGHYKYYYNPDLDTREIVGDDYSNSKEKYYGNNDVEGPNAMHGTAVAGAIAADRSNDIGVKGVAKNVKIMAVRCVPEGDERDKDVANAIRYAVDNGASVINMSFGKGYKWDKRAVDKAIRYAAKKDVLLVHAAGNDGKENTIDNNYPNDTYEKPFFLSKKTQPDNWIEVGALSWENGSDMVATFSNYSENHVDVFAPGHQLYLPSPNDRYKDISGTSFAAPVVAGVAATLRSYFPDLSAAEVKDIIMESSITPKGNVKKPGSGELVPFESLSKSGGMINAFNALIKANKSKSSKRGEKKSKPNKTDKNVAIP